MRLLAAAAAKSLTFCGLPSDSPALVVRIGMNCWLCAAALNPRWVGLWRVGTDRQVDIGGRIRRFSGFCYALQNQTDQKRRRFERPRGSPTTRGDLSHVRPIGVLRPN
ncbi:hypothetical protein FrEUN1fDRAFT_1961 [Parafrankia sp. EUN1f]|nr:hypothetical protein FrEUN1fDRAFT_1961 [Parafrankia sp. EUN1f]